MSFDHNSTFPLVQPRKRTTQVNIGIAVGVVIFFAVVGGILWSIMRNPEKTRSDRYEQVQERQGNK